MTDWCGAMLKKIFISLVLLLFGAMGVYSIYDDIDLIKRMDRESVVFLVSSLIGIVVYGIALYLISNRKFSGMTPQTCQAWYLAAKWIRIACILCGCYVSLLLTGLPSYLPSAWNKPPDFVLTTVVFHLFWGSIVVLGIGCLLIGLIRAVLEPVMKNDEDDHEKR